MRYTYEHHGRKTDRAIGIYRRDMFFIYVECWTKAVRTLAYLLFDGATEVYNV